MALAHDLQIKRNYNRRTTCGTGAFKQAAHKVVVFKGIDLKPKRLGCVCGHVFDRTNRHGRQRKRHAEFLGSFRGLNLSVGGLHACQTNRGKGHWHRDVLADHLRFCGAVCHVDGDPLAQTDLVEIRRVFAERLFGPTAAFRVIIKHLGRAPFVQAFEISDGCDDGHDSGLFVELV